MNNFDIRSPVFLTYLFLSLLVGVPLFFLVEKSFFIPLVVALASSFLLILIMIRVAPGAVLRSFDSIPAKSRSR